MSAVRGAWRGLLPLGLVALAAGCPDSLAPPAELVFSEPEAWPVRMRLPPAEAGLVLVTNGRDDTVSLVGLPALIGTASDSSAGAETTPLEVLHLPVGLSPVELEGPHHAGLDPLGRFFYVPLSANVPGAGGGPHGAHGTGSVDGEVVKVDARTGLKVASARVDRSPGDILVSPDGKTLYVSHYDLLRMREVLKAGGGADAAASRLLVLDAETMQRRAAVPVCPAAHGMAFSPDGTRLYVSCITDEVAEVDLTRADLPVRKVGVSPNAGRLDAIQHQPYALSVAPDSGDVWVSCLVGGDVHVLRGAPLTGEGARRLDVTGTPMFGDFTRDGATLLLPTQAPDQLLVVDPHTLSVERTVELPAESCVNTHQVRLTPSQADALVVCEGLPDRPGLPPLPGALLVLDVGTGTVRRSVPVGLFSDFVGVLQGRGP